MALATGDIFRAAVIWNLASAGEVANVFHVRVTGITAPLTTIEELTAIEDYFVDLYGDTAVVSQMTDALTHDRIELYNVAQDAPMVDVPAMSSLNGVNAGERLPSGVACMMLLRTETKRRVGRKYLPPFVEGSLTNGLFASSATNLVNDMGSRMVADWVHPTIDITFRVVVKSATSNLYSLPFQAFARTEPAYQRRRKPGIGS